MFGRRLKNGRFLYEALGSSEIHWPVWRIISTLPSASLLQLRRQRR